MKNYMLSGIKYFSFNSGKLIIYVLFFVFSLFSVKANSQIRNQDIKGVLGSGIPQITYYSTDDYHSHPQNWAAVQDSAGIMFFGNGNGVLTYDGATWDLITLPNEAAVFALAIDKNNRIYVGAESEIGYLDADQYGKIYYVSLLTQLKEDEKNISGCRIVYCTSRGIYFQTSEELLLWNGKKFKVWKAEENIFVCALKINDSIYINVKNKGLRQVVDNKLEMLYDGGKFNHIDAYVALPYDNKHLLFATKKNGLFLYDGNDFSQFKTENDKYLKDNNIFCGVLLSDSTFAFGTLQGGVVIINKQGKQILRLNNENELNSLMVFGLYKDKSDILWAVLNDGIAKIEYPSPFSKFAISPKSKENVQFVKEFHNTIYAGTDKGLYYFKNGVFHLLKGANQRVWSLLQVNNSLLVALERGLYLLKDKSKTLMQINDLAINSLKRSKIDTNRIFIGHQLGLSSVYYKNGKWNNEENIPGIHLATYDVIEMPNGNMWIETNVNYIWKVSFQNKENALHLTMPAVKKYGTDYGLPDDLGQLLPFEDNVIFVCVIYSDDIYTYNKSTDKFILDTVFNNLTNLQAKEFHLSSIDNKGNVWFDKKNDGNSVNKIVAWKIGRGNYRIEDLKEARIINRIGGSFYYDTSNHFVLYGGKDEIIKHDLNINEKQDSIFYAHISKVIYNNDSLLYGGVRFTSNNKLFKHSLLFYNNKLRFQFSALSYHDEKANEYQYYLEGFDKGWSNWLGETQSDYTNLSEGNYTFHVRAKNIYGYLSNEDEYTFIILPPWYRSWWSFLLSGLVLAGFISVIIKWRLGHLRKEKIELEKIVEERTHQLSKQAKQLSEQAEQLKEVDKQKARFFANISHEFRTPLTLIKGPVEQLLQTPGESLSQDDKVMINNNANRLLRLVNQLLDISKLDSKSMELNPVNGDILGFLRALGSAFSSYAEQQNIKYYIRIPEKELYTMFDQDRFEKIIYNLLSNAFKFTPENGTVSLSTYIKNNFLTIEITDTGKGISSEHLPYIFERFFQSDNSTTREYEGTGIGLSLTKEIVTLMRGEILVESQPGKGSKFTVIIPFEEITGRKDVSIEEDIKRQPFISEETVKTFDADSQEEKQEKPVILIVEDNIDMRGFIRKQLTQSYNILEASDGEEGLKIANKEIPDLVITDLMMPKMDGMAFCEKLKNKEYTSHIPIIMLTAKAGQEHKIEGLETGADEYLTKPFDRKELQTRINNLIHQRQELRKKFSREIILQPRNINISSMDEQFLQKLENLIEDNISDEKFGVPEMQSGLAMSKTQLHRKMKAIIDQAPGEFLRNYRLKRAAQLILGKSDSVTQIAYSVGFSNLSYFTKCFKRPFWCHPF